MSHLFVNHMLLDNHPPQAGYPVKVGIDSPLCPTIILILAMLRSPSWVYTRPSQRNAVLSNHDQPRCQSSLHSNPSSLRLLLRFRRLVDPFRSTPNAKLSRDCDFPSLRFSVLSIVFSIYPVFDFNSASRCLISAVSLRFRISMSCSSPVLIAEPITPLRT